MHSRGTWGGQREYPAIQGQHQGYQYFGSEKRPIPKHMSDFAWGQSKKTCLCLLLELRTAFLDSLCHGGCELREFLVGCTEKYTSWTSLELFNYRVANPLNLSIEGQNVCGFLRG